MNTIKCFEFFSEKSTPLVLPVSRLLGKKWKVEEVIAELKRGELSFSKEVPITVTLVPHLRKYLVVDGHHRIIEKAQEGSLLPDRSINCVIYDYMKKVHDVEKDDVYTMDYVISVLYHK